MNELPVSFRFATANPKICIFRDQCSANRGSPQHACQSYGRAGIFYRATHRHQCVATGRNERARASKLRVGQGNCCPYTRARNSGDGLSTPAAPPSSGRNTDRSDSECEQHSPWGVLSFRSGFAYSSFISDLSFRRCVFLLVFCATCAIKRACGPRVSLDSI